MKNLSVEDARARMLAEAAQLGAETIALADAPGRVLAEDIVASRDQPPFDSSAMDGWAVRRADALSEARALIIVGESAAGRAFAGDVREGQAVRIYTGAPIPAGADCVVIQEEARREGESVRVGPLESIKSNIRRRAGDFGAGDLLLRAGVGLNPAKLSLAAAAGCAALSVARRPRLAILATGDELVKPGDTPRDDQIFESCAPAVRALALGWGADVMHLPRCGDSLEDIAAALAPVQADILVTIGGASVGDYDLVKPALRALGLDQKVETIKLRPGKPTWFGVLPDQRLVLGLPGNPASAMACAELFLKPILLKMQGAPYAPRFRAARLATALPAEGPREHYQRACLHVAADGALTVTPFSDQDSSLMTVFAEADALLRRLPGAPSADVGELVEVLPLSAF